MNRWSIGDFSDSATATIVYGNIMVNICHGTFVKTHKNIQPNVNYVGNYGLWLIMMYQYVFISYNKYTTLVGVGY